MTEYFIALDLPLDEDLADFSALLWQQGVAHHIAEEGNRQLLRVGDAQQQEQVRALYARLKTGELHIERRSAPARSTPVLQRRSGPVVWVLLLLSIAGALLPQLDRSFESVALLTFYPLDLESGQLLAQWPVGEPWRLLTPMFLHFGLMHIAFNGLWLWELGGMIERRQGGMALLGLVLLVAAASNMAQAMMTVSLFGGMSGVIYGLLGYILAWNRLRPVEAFPLVRGVATVMLIWLLVCMAGFTRLLGLGEIANTAHFSGLVMGLLLGVAASFLRRRPV